jgi:hypothetical protein
VGAPGSAATGRSRRRRAAPPASGAAVHPLRSAEPRPVTGAQRAELTLTAGQAIPEPGQWINDLAAGRRTFADRLADRQSVVIPSEDHDYGDLGQVFSSWTGPAKGAILQPPKPEIRPSARWFCSRDLTAFACES